MGGAAAAVAMRRGLAVERAVFLAPPANPATYWRRFLQALGLSDDVREHMEHQFEERFAFRFEELDVPSRAAGMTVPLLVFHDHEDREVAWSDGAAIARAWPGARLVTTRGLGHKLLVHDPSVVSEAVAFATSAAPAAALTI
jgi:pimeloyl-ACP methyl ester carboxylesterase